MSIYKAEKVTTPNEGSPVWFRPPQCGVRGIRYGDVVIDLALIHYLRIRYSPSGEESQ
ncbi:hypothetical protein [Methanobacterium sp. CWC-01]|jgi:hypothetical protein|uniref:hypothetical protein n=1 Tax=Methanobacterium aridiramus TaxID=2584467 RepID=UPI002577956A|nr:hypothetical protein [Methanobacterium sp. CWC-01]